ncbi:MAG TPA: arginine--tRNA ligase, partial [Nocardioides sp.]|nr:arginine--tRNA ligase [Nocardioides sp.]
MNPEQLSETIVDALAALVADGAITLPDGVPTQVTVERPRQKGHGDYATNVALQLAKKVQVGGQGTNPRAFADLVAGRLRVADGISEVEVAGPGFLNVTVEAGAQGQVAADVVAAGEAYGSSDAFAGEKINLEFVSANPTGPLHIGAVRWAAVGDALGRVFTFAGAEVTREYYFNDHGAQLDRFSSSLLAWAKGR